MKICKRFAKHIIDNKTVRYTTNWLDYAFHSQAMHNKMRSMIKKLDTLSGRWSGFRWNQIAELDTFFYWYILRSKNVSDRNEMICDVYKICCRLLMLWYKYPNINHCIKRHNAFVLCDVISQWTPIFNSMFLFFI